MMGETFWVELVAFSIAAACTIAIIVVAIRERRRTGAYPSEVIGGRGQSGWFFLVTWLIICVHTWIPDRAIAGFPLCVIIPGLETSLLIAFAAVAIHAMSWVFRAEWHWRIGLWISTQLLFPAIFLCFVLDDVHKLGPNMGVWIGVGLIAIFAAPFCTRFAHQERLLGGQGEPNTQHEPDFRLWRPGDPM